MCEFSSDSSVSSPHHPLGGVDLNAIEDEYEKQLDIAKSLGIVTGFFAASLVDYKHGVSVAETEDGSLLIITTVAFGKQEFRCWFSFRGESSHELVSSILPTQVSLIREQMRVASAAALRGADDEVACCDLACMNDIRGGVTQVG